MPNNEWEYRVNGTDPKKDQSFFYINKTTGASLRFDANRLLVEVPPPSDEEHPREYFFERDGKYYKYVNCQVQVSYSYPEKTNRFFSEDFLESIRSCELEGKKIDSFLRKRHTSFEFNLDDEASKRRFLVWLECIDLHESLGEVNQKILERFDLFQLREEQLKTTRSYFKMGLVQHFLKDDIDSVLDLILKVQERGYTEVLPDFIDHLLYDVDSGIEFDTVFRIARAIREDHPEFVLCQRRLLGLLQADDSKSLEKDFLNNLLKEKINILLAIKKVTTEKNVVDEQCEVEKELLDLFCNQVVGNDFGERTLSEIKLNDAATLMKCFEEINRKNQANKLLNTELEKIKRENVELKKQLHAMDCFVAQSVPRNDGVKSSLRVSVGDVATHTMWSPHLEKIEKLKNSAENQSRTVTRKNRSTSQ